MNKELTLAVAAKLLHYPDRHAADQARAAADWLDELAPEAAVMARRFAADVSGLSLGALEEAYTAAFDFTSVGTLYAGDYLFGASQARATFLSRLQVLRREYAMPVTLELFDHVAELLHLAAAMRAGDERDELLRDAVLPTVRAALAPLQQAKHPFENAVAAVIAVVEAFCGAAATASEPARIPSAPAGRLPVVPDEPELFDPSAEVRR